MQPLILSLKLDGASFERLDALRRAHFPPHRNQLSAHLTLFHALPGEQEPFVREVLDEVCARTSAMNLEFPGAFSLGKGVAIEVDCPPLKGFRGELQNRFLPPLSAQDSQKMRPHITICNKVTPEAARELLKQVSANWESFEGRGVGVSLWRYLGGPWEWLRDWEFARF
ncbi:2'-5' RNA ligase superfamily protein [Abditibacterium utsteinense]|uniref:2'-5' RNA ligase superfamily protein n=1 Tax=Abditibacterium utsteinense TaxID=1960156 RepID=A0A2S8SWS8_9BACT|nr:2'-5' RNA ligase family protein [Abditibacterium utsteinense]PQV65258.1 2'-5' RNA ligase superfamily protein [Abditibacterium utsteinense]